MFALPGKRPRKKLTAARKGFVVGIRKNGSDLPVGVGFVVADRHVVTCAHVVNAALGRDLLSAERPREDARVQIDFPLLGEGDGPPLRNCLVAVWDPPSSDGQYGRDIAGLVFVGGDVLPPGGGPARLLDSGDIDGCAVSLFGFPGDPPRKQNGAWSSCQLRGVVGGGRLQLDTIMDSAMRVQPGYSGAPAVTTDKRGDVVVGMVATASRDGSIRDAYAVPVTQVIDAWPQLLAHRVVPPCPYRGLRTFTGHDAKAGFFVGRENELSRLQGMVRSNPFVAIVGPSGVGKSSLVGAGLVPALQIDDWAVASFRPGIMPFDSMARALLDLEPGKHSLTDLADRADRLREVGLWRLAHQVALLAGRKVALICDQLEEIVTLTSDESEQRAFLDQILPPPSFSANDVEVRVVCALRSDFLPLLIELPGIGQRLQDRQLNLSPLDIPTMTRVIVEPAAVAGVTYVSGLAETIAREASFGRGGLPLLEFTLTELWSHQQDRRLTFDGYHALGGVAGALNRHAERIYYDLCDSNGLDPERIRRVLLSMVRTRGGAAEGVRVVARREQLGEDWSIAQALAAPEHRLVVLGPDGPDTAEIAHEAIIREWRRLGRWVDEDAAFQRWLAVTEERAAEGDLLSAARVAEAQGWLGQRRADMPESVIRLIEMSESALLQQQELEQSRRQTEELLKQSQLLRKELWEHGQSIERRNREKSDLLANMGHQLRMHLTSLLVLAKLLADNPGRNLTPQQVEFVRTIHGAGSDLLSMADDILDLAKMQAGRMNVEQSRVQFADIHNWLMLHFAPQAIEKGLEFHIRISRRLNGSITTDAQRLRDILRNLLSNALKFTESGSVTLRIAPYPGANAGRDSLPAEFPPKVAFTVTDTGIGIPADRLNLIFEPFQQADGHISRRYGGTGLGLSLSRDLAHLLGGALTVVSAPGHGSSFTLQVPDMTTVPSAAFASKLPMPQSMASEAERKANGDALKNARVLLIDDDVRNVFALTSALELHGMNVFYADNGADGVRMLAEHPETDIVLIDAMMPDQDGYETTREIRRNPRCVNLPLIFVTAKVMPGDREEALRAGATDYLTKPVDLDELLGVMSHWIAIAGQSSTQSAPPQ